jgi:hypothetical protein
MTSSYTIMEAPDARWVMVPFNGGWCSAWLQASDDEGHWVRFSFGGPFKLVSEIKEVGKF